MSDPKDLSSDQTDTNSSLQVEEPEFIQTNDPVDNTVDEDLKNAEEIDEELERLNIHEGYEEHFEEVEDEYNASDEERRMMAELEAEMDFIEEVPEGSRNTHHPHHSSPSYHTTTGSGGNNSGGSFLPQGAVPSQNGKLSKYAAEFWFPECRNCTCCNGYKHGCPCCQNGVTICQNATCSEGVAQAPAKSTTASTGGGSVLPAGAVPSQNGVLSKYAAEFWFPECRNCTCCKGYKHGCDCCKDGNTQCIHTGCSDTVTATTTTTTSTTTTTTTSAPPVTSPPTLVNPSQSQPNTHRSNSPRSPNYTVTSPTSGGGGGGGVSSNATICRFGASCRFGSSCRFIHPGTVTSGGNGSGMVTSPHTGYSPHNTYSPSTTSRTECIYFKQGNCQFGNNCRFAHV